MAGHEAGRPHVVDSHQRCLDVSYLFTTFPHNMPHPSGRLRRVYNEQERAKIDPFKSLYMKAMSPSERKDVARVSIFPALFTYWSSIGIDLNDNKITTRSEVRHVNLHIIIYYLI